MVKVSARQVRSMRRELHKMKQDAKSSRMKVQKALKVSENVAAALAYKLALEKQTNSIFRKSLKNFSQPFYKLKRENNNLKREIIRVTGEKHVLQRGLVQLNELRKENKRRKNAKTRYINI